MGDRVSISFKNGDEESVVLCTGCERDKRKQEMKIWD